MLVISTLRDVRTPLEATWHGATVEFEYYPHRFTPEREKRVQKELIEARKRAEEAEKKKAEEAEKGEAAVDDSDPADPWTVDFLHEFVASWQVALNPGDKEPAALTKENIALLSGRLLLAMAEKIGDDVTADPPKEPNS